MSQELLATCCECGTVDIAFDAQVYDVDTETAGVPVKPTVTSYDSERWDKKPPIFKAPDVRRYSSNYSCDVKFDAVFQQVISGNNTSLFLWGYRLEHDTESEVIESSGEWLEIDCTERWEGVLKVTALYSTEPVGTIPANVYRCDCSLYGIPEYYEVTIPSSLRFDQLCSNNNPTGSNCEWHPRGRYWSCEEIPTFNCSDRLFTESFSQALSGGGNTITLKCAGILDDGFLYRYSGGAGMSYPASLCVEAKIKVSWEACGLRPDGVTATQWGDATGNYDSEATNYSTNGTYVNGNNPPPYLRAVAKATVRFKLLDDDSEEPVKTITLESTQFLSSLIPFQTLLSAYRNITELQSGNCNTREHPYPCVPTTGDTFAVPSGSYLTWRPPMNPLFLFASRGGSLSPNVNALGDFANFYMPDVGHIRRRGPTVYVPNLDGTTTKYTLDGPIRFCPEYSVDPNTFYSYGFTGTPCPTPVEMEQYHYAILGETVAQWPSSNVSVLLNLEVSTGSGWPNSGSKCQCKQFELSTGYTTIVKSTTSYKHPNITISNPENCSVVCATGTDSVTGQLIDMNVMPRGIAVSVPDEIDLGFLDCLEQNNPKLYQSVLPKWSTLQGSYLTADGWLCRCDPAE